MDDKHLDSVCKQIYKRFPEIAGNRPKVKAQNSPANEGNVQYLLVLQGFRSTVDGKVINRIVRVVVSEKGKIVKITTSR